jgi:hypothetical protein
MAQELEPSGEGCWQSKNVLTPYQLVGIKMTTDETNEYVK